MYPGGSRTRPYEENELYRRVNGHGMPCPYEKKKLHSKNRKILHMPSDPRFPQRKPIRLPEYDYAQCGGYFVPICTHDREHMFGEIVDGEMMLNGFGEIVEQEILNTEKMRSNVYIEPYVIMPNHVHMVICIEPRRGDLPVAQNDGVETKHNTMKTGDQQVAPTIKPQTIGAVLAGFKSAVTKQINIIRNTPYAKNARRPSISTIPAMPSRP